MLEECISVSMMLSVMETTWVVVTGPPSLQTVEGGATRVQVRVEASEPSHHCVVWSCVSAGDLLRTGSLSFSLPFQVLYPSLRRRVRCWGLQLPALSFMIVKTRVEEDKEQIFTS